MLAMFLIFAKLGTLDYAATTEGAGTLAPERPSPRSRCCCSLGAIGQERADPAARLVARRDGGPDPGLGAHPRRDDGHRRRVPRVPGPSSSSRHRAARARPWRGSARSPRCSPRPSRSSRTTSNGCWRTRPSASSATCSSRSGSARTPPAIFHMVTHAFFKALLFLGAGSVIHGLHGEQDMRLMGALRKWMPITAGTFIVGWLSIAGIIPFSGFWSKDEILASAWIRDDYALWFVGAVGSVVHRVLHDAPGVPRVLRRRPLGRDRSAGAGSCRRPMRPTLRRKSRRKARRIARPRKRTSTTRRSRTSRRGS